MSPSARGAAREQDRRRLLLACCLTAVILAVEVAGGLWTGSLALLSDAGHVFTDLLALLLAFFAASFATRPATSRKTWGYHRLEVLSAQINGVLLAGIGLLILREAWLRLGAPRPVHTPGMMAVAALGLAGNLAGVWLLSRGSGSINLKAALWHLMGDTVSSVAVLLGGLVIALTGAVRVDPLLSMAIALVILFGAVRLLREAGHVLLEGVPGELDCDAVEAAMRSVPGVTEVHDLHIWSITSGQPALSGHVVVPRTPGLDREAVLTEIKVVLRDRFDITHTTIQIEPAGFEEIGEIHAPFET